jgi:hypothetical protein
LSVISSQVTTITGCGQALKVAIALRDMCGLLGENELRPVNIGSFVIILCFDSRETDEVRV